MSRSEELFNKLLDEHPSELILGALEEMSRLSKAQIIEPRNICEIMNRAEEVKNHQPE